MEPARPETAAESSFLDQQLRARCDAQRAAFQKNPPGYEQRVEALRRLERALVREQDRLVEVVSADFGGRARAETLALELFPVLQEIRHARRHLRAWMAPRRAPVPWQFWPARAKVVYQPLGVVGILSPWNYPLFLSLAPLAGALAAGDHVLLKPSEFAPRTAEWLRSFLADLYPPEYVDVVCGGADMAAAFARLPFDHLLFTGSTAVGRQVMRAASENLTPVTLELGGKSPALVHPDYPLVSAARRIMAGKLYNAGQTCVAPDYVLLPEARLEEFVNLARQAAAAMYPRLVDNPDYTRIVDARHYERLARLLDDARQKGAAVAEVNPAGETCHAQNRVFPPTLVWNVRDEMDLMREEIFGPVLPLAAYRSLEEAIAYLNARPRPLALYYFDEKGSRAARLLERTVSGGVTINDCIFHVGQPNLPFGGVGPSGMGEYHGFSGFETFSKRKGVLVQPRWSPLDLMRPPYGRRARILLKVLIGA